MPVSETPSENGVEWQKWRGLSDDDLLRLDLTANEPEELAGLIDEVRDGKMPAPEFDYNMKGRDEFVRCAFCRKPNHFRGLVARYEDGARILVGRICAEKHLGTTFKSDLSDFDAALARQSLLKRQSATAKHCAGLCEELRQLAQHPSVSTFTEARGKSRYVLGSFWSDLSNVAKQSGFLKIERVTIDYVAIQSKTDTTSMMLGKHRRKYLKQQAEQNSAPTTVVTENLGPLEGASFFQPGLCVGQILDEQLKELRNVTATLCSKGVPSKDITAAFVKLAEIKHVLSGEFERLNDIRSAFLPANLQRIVVWLNDKAKTRYHQIDSDERYQRNFYSTGAKIGENGRYNEVVSLPPVYHVPAPTILNMLTAALAETGA